MPAPLSQAETNYLSSAMGQMASVESRLKDTERPLDEADRRVMAEVLADARSKVKTIWTMKGNYPK